MASFGLSSRCPHSWVFRWYPTQGWGRIQRSGLVLWLSGLWSGFIEVPCWVVRGCKLKGSPNQGGTEPYPAHRAVYLLGKENKICCLGLDIDVPYYMCTWSTNETEPRLGVDISGITNRIQWKGQVRDPLGYQVGSLLLLECSTDTPITPPQGSAGLRLNPEIWSGLVIVWVVVWVCSGPLLGC